MLVKAVYDCISCAREELTDLRSLKKKKAPYKPKFWTCNTDQHRVHSMGHNWSLFKMYLFVAWLAEENGCV